MSMKVNNLEVIIKDTNFAWKLIKTKKNYFNKVCSNIEIDMSTAIMIFVNKMIDKKHIPFEYQLKSDLVFNTDKKLVICSQGKRIRVYLQ